MAEMLTKIVLRNDSSENWSLANPVLLKGECGIEFLNNGQTKLKIGDGITSWNQLPYFGGGIEEALKLLNSTKKFEISNTPDGTLVNYFDREIRVMCPAGTVFTKQSVGENENPNMYYMTFKAYAPEEAVSFKEGDKGIIINEMFDFNGPASGIDELGRKYSVCWFPLASYDEKTGTWNYFGQNSTTAKYLGWDYVVEWYNKDGLKIGFDSIRVNLSNESCHYVNEPYYMGSINIDKLSQKEGQYLELYGGSATDNITLEG